METIKIKSIDGISLDAVIHKTIFKKPLGCVIQVHGISTDMNEGGMFVRLANGLTSIGFNIIRFTYRGHGNSEGTQKGTTIAGELLDLQAVLNIAKELFNLPIIIVAASFGAVSSCLLLPYIQKYIYGLVLWNPVLDLKRTFINPKLSWGKKNFNKKSIEHLISKGFFLLDDTFEIGIILWEEMKLYNVYQNFVDSSVQSIIIHGDKDSYVPYSVSKNACKQKINCKFFKIENSDHGFDSIENENRAIAITVNWIEELFKKK